MKKLFFILILLLASCTNNEAYKVSMDSVTLTPNSFKLEAYGGELLTLHINNPTAKGLHINPDIVIYTKVDGKEFLVQRKNELTIKPSASFSFSIGGSKSYDEGSIGIVIESSKELLVFNHKEFEVAPFTHKSLNFSININNLYYTKDMKNILITKEELYGYLNLYNGDDSFRVIPFTMILNK